MLPNITIHPVSKKDAPMLLQLMNTENFYRFIGDRGIRTVEAMEAYIEERMGENIFDSGFSNFMISDATSGEIVGSCSLLNREFIEGFDMGYAVFPEFEGKGYATAGAKEMIRLAFDVHMQDQISAIIHPENKRSIQLVSKLDFNKVGNVTIPNTETNHLLYRLAKSI